MKATPTPTVTNVHTDETPASRPARTLALQTVADLSTRKLAHFHWREASEALADVEHKIRDYGDEDSDFEPREAKEINEKLAVIEASLGHVRALVNEAAEVKGGAS